MDRFATATNKTLSDGVEVLTTNLEWMQQSSENGTLKRFLDCYTPGLLRYSGSGGGAPFAIVADVGGTSVSIGIGTAYDENGERIEVSATDALVAYSSTNNISTSSNGLGGTVLTPQSSGTTNIAIPEGTTYFGIKYLFSCDTTAYSLHPVTSERLYYKWKDGYTIVSQTSGSTFTDTSVTYIGSATRTGTTITVTAATGPYFGFSNEVNTSVVFDNVIVTSSDPSSPVVGSIWLIE